MIAIIDYGAGNLKSVKKAFDFLGVDSKVVASPDELIDVDKLVLPGVGAFGAALEKLHQLNFFQFVQQWIQQDKPFLGICLGMQLLMEGSAESPGAHGLGFIQGKCLRFDRGKVPQIGWNQIIIKGKSNLLHGIEDRTYFYFLHSYFVQPDDESCISATAEYGVNYPAILKQGNVYAVQFHPEKSSDAGLKLLKNWIEKC